ncbi:type II toxin-antitoxin system RelE/ParE family toxin [Proteiniclasticum sp. SCR006]|uniref:Type II toxin-antitoxin system RelE/ParE family toxin n=1 Tax=Proteiniclasticum aestuarii TaxID=2817862 RepID=A0A939KGJ4_9CLOT|nr:type II toxin-antitoxin system RelE/ParE family toxin [Proteiniclasticum aestuarii]MBO1264494.1 type II toxin-antitoxin system RelE/ParE family toxin [Proteiniclasticum aestuarii]
MWDIEFYRTENDIVPVSDFIEEMDVKMQAKIFREIDILQELGIELRFPHSRALGDGLFELRISSRGNISRIIYFHFNNNKFVLLHGFVKKTQKTPRKEIEAAKNYMNDYRRRNE